MLFKYTTILLFVSLGISAERKVCVDYRVKNWYDNKVIKKGLPPTTNNISFVRLPQELSPCELEELHKYCVEEINKYRSGEYKFVDGTDDTNVLEGLSPLIQATHINSCSSESAMGDLYINVRDNPPIGNKGCIGAHANAFVCEWKRSASQNSCCARGGFAWGKWDKNDHRNIEMIKTQLSKCFKQMWNEGIRDGQKGHWKTMRSKLYQYVSCGFAITDNGRIMMTQDFTKGLDNKNKTCSCIGKKHRQWDGCGRRCIEEGNWYCRNPGEKTGPFIKNNCLLTVNCTQETKIRARCCHNNAGNKCNSKEKISKKQCYKMYPKCLM